MGAQHVDGWLIARIREGDLAALGVLYERYKTRVYRTALALCQDEGVAANVLQEVFLRFYIQAPGSDIRSSFVPWVYRITVDAARRHRRPARRWIRSLQSTVDRWLRPMQLAAGRRADGSGLLSLVQRTIDDLSPEQRTVLVLYHLEELQVEEIAEVMGVPEGTVRFHLHQSHESLRQMIRDRVPWTAPEIAYDST